MVKASAIKSDEPKAIDGLTEGRIVHFVMPNGEHRPAIVVRVWGSGPCEGYANLQVFTDGSNDATELPTDESPLPYDQVKAGMVWVTSVCPDDETKAPGTWHWIERA
jgi:hypothetical protein